MKGDRQLYLPTALLVLLGLLSGSCFLTAAIGEDDHLRRLFESLDRDHDGQLMRQELKQYIGSLAPEYSSSTKLDQAVEAAIGRLDSPDVGFGVSWKELEHHLHTLLQVRGSMRPLTTCGCVGSICSISSHQHCSCCACLHRQRNGSCIIVVIYVYEHRAAAGWVSPVDVPLLHHHYHTAASSASITCQQEST